MSLAIGIGISIVISPQITTSTSDENFILQEDSFFILQEDGSFILQES